MLRLKQNDGKYNKDLKRWRVWNKCKRSLRCVFVCVIHAESLTPPPHTLYAVLLRGSPYTVHSWCLWILSPLVHQKIRLNAACFFSFMDISDRSVKLTFAVFDNKKNEFMKLEKCCPTYLRYLLAQFRSLRRVSDICVGLLAWDMPQYLTFYWLKYIHHHPLKRVCWS